MIHRLTYFKDRERKTLSEIRGRFQSGGKQSDFFAGLMGKRGAIGGLRYQDEELTEREGQELKSKEGFWERE